MVVGKCEDDAEDIIHVHNDGVFFVHDSYTREDCQVPLKGEEGDCRHG